MKKIMIVLTAALFLGACHCAKCTTQTAGRYTNKPSCHGKLKCKPGCKCPQCHRKPAPVAAKPAPAPAQNKSKSKK